MACKISLVFLATLAVARCNPLGQTICESQTTPSFLPNAFPFLPINYPGRNILSPRTTVCESTPNVGLNLGLNSLPFLPFNPLNLGMFPQMPINTPSTTICESSTMPTPSLMGSLPSTTVCESTSMPYPNVLPMPMNNLPSTTICESTQTPFNNLPMLPMTPKSTTVCESSQNIPNLGMGLPYSMGGLGMPMMGMGMPYPMGGLGLPNMGLPVPILATLLNYLGMM